MDNIDVGMQVVFRSKVFDPPYAPYYDAYKGHRFEVVKMHHGRSHVELKCIDDPKIKVDGYVHPDELKRL